ncbi:ribonuclease 3 [Echria macrotheca]|uniref:Ribonuclease 3 n=1 Tax=Echria macrotheca TaxID=438768 RepID=A0AAJ0BNI0_9PEZI|nr:ribonuclease 3 [Echria macrotheca]
MGKKRPRSEAPSADSSDFSQAIPKRPKPDSDPALSSLLEHADELIDCLRWLQSNDARRGGQSTIGNEGERLSSLSIKLLPAFQALAAKTSATASTPETQILAGLPIPNPNIVTKWTTADIAKSTPPLPKILDPKLEEAALTHTGSHVKGINYERLEWVGDAYLEVIATALIHWTFPTLPEGRCAQVRELLVRNATVSTFTTMYGLHKRARLPMEFEASGRAGGTTASEKARVKTLADLFEAYVGAIILSDPANGPKRVADWLKILWGPTIQEQMKQEANKPTDADQVLPKTRLAQLIGGKDIKIEYRDLPARVQRHKDHKLPLFSVGCFLYGWGESGKKLGEGTATGKKDAGQQAAQMALDNEKMLSTYIERKKAHDAARKEAAAASSEE